MKMILLVLLILKMSAVCSVVPMVKVSECPLDGVTKLCCWVYGFYPQAVTVKWIKNGINEIIENQSNEIFSYPENTYQTTVSIDLPIRKTDTYTCHVDHSSLPETVIILWGYKSKGPEDDGSPNTGRIIGIVVGVVVVLIGVCVLGLFIWKKYSGRRTNGGGHNQYTYIPCFKNGT